MRVVILIDRYFWIMENPSTFFAFSNPTVKTPYKGTFVIQSCARKGLIEVRIAMLGIIQIHFFKGINAWSYTFSNE